jgi:hypothetical protein
MLLDGSTNAPISKFETAILVVASLSNGRYHEVLSIVEKIFKPRSIIE